MAKPSGRRTAQFKLPQGQPQPSVPSLENNFVAGLKTEYTGLNFPENACTATSNCRFNRTGNVTRRNGFDYEANFKFNPSVNRTNAAISSFLWENAGGDGNTNLYVLQVDGTLYFYNSTTSTVSNPLSSNLLTSTVPLSTFSPAGAPPPGTAECQYAFGNGYLFVFHPNLDPFYCTFINGVVSGIPITVQIRDFVGVAEPGVADSNRPSFLTDKHQYNLQNQGWTNATPWSTTSTTVVVPGVGSSVFTVGAPVPSGSIGTFVTVSGGILGILTGITGLQTLVANMSGVITNISGSNITINITSSNFSTGAFAFIVSENWTIAPSTSQGRISTWFNAVGNYPSNTDIWWTFKDTSNVFNPGLTIGNVTLDTGPAPKGSYILNAFNQQRGAVSGVIGSGVQDVATTVRPNTGAWFAGRVWYSGIDAATSVYNLPFSWTETIYFSQIITDTSQFGRCYQKNDPTSQDLFDLLPTDGGTIQIQGSGSIHKLFPVVNGLLVFAANGIWFITGNQGIGFTATDYTVSKLSGEHSLSATSFVNVTGYPVFWNVDGIYMVAPGQSLSSGQKSLDVKNLTLASIKQFYDKIPLSSKKLARGSYNHITGEIQWLYKNTEATSNLDAYSFDSILNFLTWTESFSPWSLSNTGPTNNPYIHGIVYVEGPGGLNVTPPLFKYITSSFSGGVYNFTFSEEKDNINWVDFFSSSGINYVSNFTTAYRLKGKGQRKFQPQYIYVYSENPIGAYTWNGIWDFAGTNISNRFSPVQVVNINKPLYNKSINKLRTRGNGYVLQQAVGSISGKPFDISGWSVLDTIGIE